MEKTILQAPQHRARFGMRPKNMSHTLKFTSSVGQIIPCYYDFLYPGDKVRISDLLFTRTQPMHTAALVSVTEHIEYFFVPAHLLNSKMTDFFTGVHSTPFTHAFGSMDDGILNSVVFNATNIEPFLRYLHTKAINPKTNDYRGYEFQRLMDSLGYGHDLLSWLDEEIGNSTQTRSFNSLRLQAYQKICQDYFWRDDWDEHDMRAFNSDSGSYSSLTDVLNLCELHTAPWKKDFFTNIVPQTIFGQDSPNSTGDLSYQHNPFVGGLPYSNYLGGLMENNSRPYEWFPHTSGSTQTLFQVNGTESRGSRGFSVSGNINERSDTTLSSVAEAMSNTQQLRLNMAIEKLFTITNFAKKDYVSQIAAHFGYKVNNFLSYRCIKIASHSVPLQINPVVSTAETSQANLAALAGYGVGSGNSKKVNFTAPCHGIFMAVYYAMPDADYGSFGIDEFNTRAYRFDFFHKEFDNLGMVPLSPKIADINQDVTNWAGLTYRFLEEKLKYNKITSGFLTEGLSHWTASRSSLAIATGVSDLYVSPSYLDSIMLVAYNPPMVDGRPAHDVYTTDPLLHLMKFNIIKLSIASVFGLPSL